MNASTHARSCRDVLLGARWITRREPKRMYHATKSPRLERLPSVLSRTGMGKSWIYREIAAGRFPPPVKIGRSSGWDTSAVDGWIENALMSGSPPYPAQFGGHA